MLKLFSNLLLDSELTTVETALGAYTVVKYRSATVRASYNGRNLRLVVSSSFVSSGRRDFVFRMCHISIIVKIYNFLSFYFNFFCTSYFSPLFHLILSPTLSLLSLRSLFAFSSLSSNLGPQSSAPNLRLPILGPQLWWDPLRLFVALCDYGEAGQHIGITLTFGVYAAVGQGQHNTFIYILCERDLSVCG